MGSSLLAARVNQRHSPDTRHVERNSNTQADLVLEGGGVKGLGTVGAVLRLLEKGYTFARIAGTSVGAVAGAIVATGTDVLTARRVMSRLELDRVPDRSRPRLPLVSEGVSLLFSSGAYEGDYIRNWLYRELRELGVTTFADLRRDDEDDDPNLTDDQRYRLVVTATDITHGRLLRLPWDYPMFNLDPDEQLVADAVRMSMSIPLYFEPCYLTEPVSGDTSTIVDGGILSNFPVDIFDRTDGRPSRWPTFGVRLLPDLPAGIDEVFPTFGLPTPPPMDLLKRVIATAFVGHDQTQLERPEIRERTITVDTSGVGITDFHLSQAGREEMLRKGRKAVDAFLTGWRKREQSREPSRPGGQKA